MGTPYTANPLATRAPAPTPGPGSVLVITLPTDGDPDAGATYAQAFESITDAIGYLSKTLQAGLPATTSVIPQLRFLDAAGNGRYLVDHNGYPTGGRIGQHREGWQSPVATPTNGQLSGSNYTVQLSTGSVVTILDPTASYNSKFVKLTPSSTSGAETYVYGPSLCIANTSFMSMSMEFEIGMNSSMAGATSNCSLFCGLSSQTDPYAGGVYDNNCIAFYKPYNHAFWYMLTGPNGIVAITTSTTVPTSGSNPVDRLRIEIQGSASAYGAYQARFFINEALVATVTSASLPPGATLLRPSFSIIGEGGTPSGSPLAYIGQVSAYWNLYSSGPNL